MTLALAVAHYKTDVGEYAKAYKEIISNATLQNGVITKLSDSGEMLVYDFNSKEKVISPSYP